MPNHCFQGYELTIRKYRENESDCLDIKDVNIILDGNSYDIYDGIIHGIKRFNEFYHQENSDKTFVFEIDSLMRVGNSIHGVVLVGEKGYVEKIVDKYGNIIHEKNKDESNLRKLFFLITKRNDKALGMMIHYAGNRSGLDPVKRMLYKILSPNRYKYMSYIIAPPEAIQRKFEATPIESITYYKNVKNINHLMGVNINYDEKSTSTVKLELKISGITNSNSFTESFKSAIGRKQYNGRIRAGNIDLDFDGIKFNLKKNGKSYTIYSTTDQENLFSLRILPDELMGNRFGSKLKYLSRDGDIIVESMRMLSERAFDYYDELLS